MKPLTPAISGDSQVDDEDTVTFTCNYPGSTLPSQTTYKWRKDSADIPNQSDQMLTITTADFESVGEYKCLAIANAVESDESTAHTLLGNSISIHFPPGSIQAFKWVSQ